jgi:predicted RecA/RadA family phage recombinase
MKNAVAEGLTIDHTPSAQRLAGACTLIGAMVGVAVADVAASTSGVFRIKGVFNLPKLSTDVVAQGVQLYWDNTNLRWTLTSAGNTAAGKAYAAAGNGVATVDVIINA